MNVEHQVVIECRRCGTERDGTISRLSSPVWIGWEMARATCLHCGERWAWPYRTRTLDGIIASYVPAAA